MLLLSLNTLCEYVQALPLRVKSFPFLCFGEKSISTLIFIFLLAGHKVDFIAPCGANKSTFWPYSRKKIVCNTGKTFILFVWLLPSLCSGIKLHTRKINDFFPSCTMYYQSMTLLLCGFISTSCIFTKYGVIKLRLLNNTC